jgi:hypothetical protein
VDSVLPADRARLEHAEFRIPGNAEHAIEKAVFLTAERLPRRSWLVHSLPHEGVETDGPRHKSSSHNDAVWRTCWPRQSDNTATDQTDARRAKVIGSVCVVDVVFASFAISRRADFRGLGGGGSSGLTVEVSAVFSMPSRKLTPRSRPRRIGRCRDGSAANAAASSRRSSSVRAWAVGGPTGFLESLDDRRGGDLDPRLGRRFRVEPVTAEDVGPLCRGRVVVRHARRGPGGDGDEHGEVRDERRELAHLSGCEGDVIAFPLNGQAGAHAT